MSIGKKVYTLMSLGLLLLSQAEAAHEAQSDLTERSVPRATHATDDVDMQKLSEAFGHFIGRNLQSPGLSFDVEQVIKGIRDGLAGTTPPLSEKEYEEMMAIVQEKAFQQVSSANLKSANAFLEKNRHAEGIVEVVPGKLQILILKEGTGATVAPHASPTIHYMGKYQDGTVFGNSEETGGPISVPLDQTIPGFSKGIVGMQEGEKRRLFIHPDLGYGTTGQLPPNELLIFDIEVVKADADRKIEKNGEAFPGEDEEEEDLSFSGSEDDEEDEREAPVYERDRSFDRSAG